MLVHYTKFIKSQAMAVFRHCERTNQNYENENIDLTKTKYNYNLGPNGNQWDKMTNRLNELQYRKQKNNITLCSWVVTAPTNLPEEKQKEFFKIMYGFLSKKYGLENVVSAYVHKDEAGPGHMHFLYVPGTRDNKLSASQTTNRSVLKKIHDEAQTLIDKYLGHEYLLRADDPEERAKDSVPVKTLKKALSALETKIEEARIEMGFNFEEMAAQKRIIENLSLEREQIKEDRDKE